MGIRSLEREGFCRNIIFNCKCCTSTEWDGSFFFAFADTSEYAVTKIDVFVQQRQYFSNAETSRIHELEDGAISTSFCAGDVRHSKQCVNLRFGEKCWEIGNWWWSVEIVCRWNVYVVVKN